MPPGLVRRGEVHAVLVFLLGLTLDVLRLLGRLAADVLEEVREVVSQLFQRQEDAGAHHVAGEHGWHDAGVHIMVDVSVAAGRLPHGLDAASAGGGVVHLGRGYHGADAAVDPGEVHLVTPLKAFIDERLGGEPHHQRIEVRGIATDDRAGQPEHVVNGTDELAARHGLTRRIALMLVAFVNQ